MSDVFLTASLISFLIFFCIAIGFFVYFLLNKIGEFLQDTFNSDSYFLCVFACMMFFGLISGIFYAASKWVSV